MSVYTCEYMVKRVVYSLFVSDMLPCYFISILFAPSEISQENQR